MSDDFQRRLVDETREDDRLWPSLVIIQGQQRPPVVLPSMILENDVKTRHGEERTSGRSWFYQASGKFMKGMQRR